MTHDHCELPLLISLIALLLTVFVAMEWQKDKENA